MGYWLTYLPDIHQTPCIGYLAIYEVHYQRPNTLSEQDIPLKVLSTPIYG